jgi:hypothetical protein
MSFSPGEIAGISIGGAAFIMIWLYGIFACVRFYGSTHSADDGEDTMSKILLERPARRLVANKSVRP